MILSPLRFLRFLLFRKRGEKGSNHSFVHSATVQPQEWRFGMALGRLHWWTADCQGAETANTTRTRLISNGRLPGEGSKEELLVPCHYYWNDTEETWHCSFPFPSVKSVPLKKKIAPFQEDFCRKERKELKEKGLCRFFFAIFAFSCGQFIFGLRLRDFAPALSRSKRDVRGMEQRPKTESWPDRIISQNWINSIN